jgi:hypothetical protein
MFTRLQTLNFLDRIKLSNGLPGPIGGNCFGSPITNNLLLYFLHNCNIEFSIFKSIIENSSIITKLNLQSLNSKYALELDNSKEQIDYLIEKARDTAQSYTNRFIDYMTFNQVSFPEYNLNSNADVYPDKDSNFTGWVL